MNELNKTRIFELGKVIVSSYQLKENYSALIGKFSLVKFNHGNTKGAELYWGKQSVTVLEDKILIGNEILSKLLPTILESHINKYIKNKLCNLDKPGADIKLILAKLPINIKTELIPNMGGLEILEVSTLDKQPLLTFTIQGSSLGIDSRKLINLLNVHLMDYYIEDLFV